MLLLLPPRDTDVLGWIRSRYTDTRMVAESAMPLRASSSDGADHKGAEVKSRPRPLLASARLVIGLACPSPANREYDHRGTSPQLNTYIRGTVSNVGAATPCKPRKFMIFGTARANEYSPQL
jgi:hypothetical protein